MQHLEDNPLFNAGRGDGRAGAIGASRHAKNPVLAARKIMEESGQVFLVAPSVELVTLT